MSPDKRASTSDSTRTGGNDAVCFTTGRAGTVFSTGIIHAWLAADRRKPEIAAGISMGAVSAAALQRVYEEIEDAGDEIPLESARWRWFRRYFEVIRAGPWKSLWRSLPSPVNFFADFRPVVDLSAPDALADDEADARETRFRLVRLGQWLAKLPVRIDRLTSLVVRHVRRKEGYGPPWTGVLFWLGAIWIGLRVYVHALFRPHFILDQPRISRPSTRSPWTQRIGRLLARLRFSPMMGWRAYLRLLAPPLIAVVTGLGAMVGMAWDAFKEKGLGAGLLALYRTFLDPRSMLGIALDGLVVVVALSALLGLVITLVLLYRGAPLRAIYRVLAIDPNVHFRPEWIRTTPRMFARLNRMPGVRLSGRWRLWAPAAGWSTYLRRWRRPALRMVLSVALIVAAWHFVLPSLETAGKAIRGSWDWKTLGRGWIVALPVTLLGTALVQMARRPLRQQILRGLRIQYGVAHPYELRRQLLKLFQRERDRDAADGSPEPPRIRDDVVKLLAVTAPLRTLAVTGDELHGSQQLWAQPGTPLVTALEAALALPGLLPPVRAVRLPGAWEKRPDLRGWYQERWEEEGGDRGDESSVDAVDEIDLVDGAVIRANPLPALFVYLHRKANRGRAGWLESASEHTPRVHVVYNVPLGASERGEDAPARFDIVEAAALGLRLAMRRDTELECRQTNFISGLQAIVDSVEVYARDDDGERRPAYRIFADEIAPERALRFDNALAPTPKEVCRMAAQGCRQTLKRLYRDEIRSLADDTSGDPHAAIGCHVLLQAIAPRRHREKAIREESPGLPDICRECTRTLQVPAADGRRYPGKPARMQRWPVSGHGGSLQGPRETRAYVAEEFHHLAKPPRVAFVASGGVFRGSFHIGMLSGLHAAGLYPDLVVGSSVGSVLGAALAGMSVADYATGCGLVQRMSAIFFHVDGRVALTRRLKSAAKQLGIRGRRVGLSPKRLRALVRRGSRSSAGFAATGAPPELIDGISDLFALPHRQTSRIAALVVAGDLEKAVSRFLYLLQHRTLVRLEVVDALIGTSLLEPAVRDVLSWLRVPRDGALVQPDFACTQPFHLDRGRRVSVFATATNLGERHSVLLGRDFLHEQLPDPVPYDFIESLLCSAAFPTVFAPRPESALLPGIGDSKTFFSDGGMFDNLPFFPTMEVLADVQRAAMRHEGPGQAEAHLRRAVEKPDLFIVGALDADADADTDPGPRQPAEYSSDMVGILKRARMLKNNVKISAFRQAAGIVDHQLRRLAGALSDPASRSLTTAESLYLSKTVNAGVLKVAPSDADHLNGTFAFCRSVGLDRETVARSIANGCFRSLARIADTQHGCGADSERLDRRAMAALLDRDERAPYRITVAGADLQRVPDRLVAAAAHRQAAERRCHCPWFRRSRGKTEEATSFGCPFTYRADVPAGESRLAASVYRTCFDDSLHLEEVRGRLDPDPAPRLGTRLARSWRRRWNRFALGAEAAERWESDSRHAGEHARNGPRP